LVLTCFARGWKTITLVFDGRVKPILITFNGSGVKSFQRRDGETPIQSILRLIACRLYSEQAQFDRDALDLNLGDGVVLLVDEPNILGTFGSEAAALLRLG